MTNTHFKPEWICTAHCHHHEYAQIVCPPGFQNTLPPTKTILPVSHIWNAACCNPENRSIKKSIKGAAKLAAAPMAHTS